MTDSSPFEAVEWDGRVLAYIVRAGVGTEKTSFITPDTANLQMGFVVYPSGGSVARHYHRPLERNLVGTAEALIVQRGRCAVDLYDDNQELLTTRDLGAGDVILLLGGGHGFRMLEDTVLLELKQGPYTGLDEKVRF